MQCACVPECVAAGTQMHQSCLCCLEMCEGALQHRSLCCVIAGAVPPGAAAKRDRVMQVGAPGSAVGYVASPALPGQKLAWQDYPSQLQTEPQLLSLDRPVSAQLPIPPSVPPGFACTVLAGDGFPSPLLERG